MTLLTYDEAQKAAFKLSINDTKGNERLIIREYNKAYDATQKKLKVLYAEIKKLNITETQYYNKLMQIGRLQELSKDISKIVDSYYGKVSTVIKDNSIGAFTNSYYYNQYALRGFVGEMLPFSFVNQKAVELSVYYTDKVWQKIKTEAKERKLLNPFKPSWSKTNTLQSLLLRNKQKELKWIKSSISQGLIQGKGFRETASLIKSAFEMSTRNSLRVVRTESMRNLNGGNYLNTLDAREQGIKIVRKWDAVLDTRTRSQSASMDGQMEDAEGYFHYPNGAISQYPGGSGIKAYDVNERCKVRNIIAGRDQVLKRANSLVFDPITGKELRGESAIIDYQKFPQWAEANNLVYKNGRWVKK